MNNDNIKVTLYGGLVVETPRGSEVVQVYDSGEWRRVAVFEPAAWRQAEALYNFLCFGYDNVRIERFN